jgi:hypothetical protein
VQFEDGELLRYSKRNKSPAMRHVDHGLGLIQSAALASHAGQAGQAGDVFDLADWYDALSERGQLAGHEVFSRFYEIGSPQGLADTHEFLTQQRKAA